MNQASVTAQEVQALRRSTGAGMMDAKSALQRSGGDFEAAVRLLREEGKAGTLKRVDRTASQGAVALAVDAGVGAIAELRCETDFVAKASEFVQMVEELATLAATEGIDAVEKRSADVEKLAGALKENISVGRVVRFDAAEGRLVDGYLHIQNDRGVNAVLVEMEGGDRSLAHEVAIHVAFARPAFLSRDQVPADEVKAEREVLTTSTLKEGKPEKAIPAIVEGKLNGWYKQRVLLDQAWVKDEKQTISQLLGDAKLLRFSQVVVGD